MKYPRPAYLEPGVKTTANKSAFFAVPITVPLFDTPISRRENFIRAARRDNPMWAPVAYSDIQSLLINELADEKPGMQLGPRFTEMPSYDYMFLDNFGNSWSWVASAGGAMLTPGTKLLEDVCDWEKTLKFPSFDDWSFRETAAKFMREKYDPDKIMHVNIHQGVTEMLVAFLGGYEQGMIAMAAEPEACKDFFARYAKFMTDFFDFLDTLYPIDFITYHDDWGTERETFFSERMMEELVYEPTKSIVDHIKGKGKVFELHTCGRVERFLPYMCDLGIDLIQMQRRANDMPKLKELYGDRIGFNAPIEGLDIGEQCSDEELIAKIRSTVDIYGKGGGLYPWLFETNPEKVWLIASEFYCYSREYYGS
jgi:hypothetical protein